MKVVSVPIAAFDEWIEMPGELIDQLAGATPGEQVIVHLCTQEEIDAHARALAAHQPMPERNGHYKRRQMRLPDTSAILTVQEAAARLRMDRNEVYQLIRAKQLATLQKFPGGKHRIPVWALERFTRGEANGATR